METKGLGRSSRPRPGVAETRIAGSWLRRNALRTLVVALIDFALVRVWGPQLINRHDDAALAAGIVCFILAAAATGWLVAAVSTDLRRLRRARRLAGPRPFERSDLP